MKYKFPIKDVEESTLKSVLVNYEDHLENGSVVVTAWNNGEGYDVDLNDRDNFRITHSQLAALRLAVKRLNKI